MKAINRNNGFSLAEVLISLGLFTVGMVFVAGVFPVSIYYATKTTERTIAGSAAQEAFAKVRLYDVNSTWLNTPPTANTYSHFFAIAKMQPPLLIDPNEFTYPSNTKDFTGRRYFWSALCKATGTNLVPVTVFVCRKVGANSVYWDRDLSGNPVAALRWPVPVKIRIEPAASGRADELQIINIGSGLNEATFVNDGCTIMDDTTGELYRVLERYPVPDNVIKVDRDFWKAGMTMPFYYFWVVPQPVGGGRNPCIAIYQKEIRF